MTHARTIWWIHCKDCDVRFPYSDAAAAADARLGRTPPERCAAHRRLHAREYSALGVSHGEVLQLRPTGVGGLGYINRERGATVAERQFLPQPDPLPIDCVIGHGEHDGLLLDRVLHGPERAFVVVGPTGSGKSTWLPLRLLRCESLVADGPICVTEPRIVATEGPAAYVGHLDTGLSLPELGADSNDLSVPWPCGAGLSVGFIHGKCKIRHDAYNRLVFMTDGFLLNQIRSGEIGKYSVIMIDEAHERSVNIDICLMALRSMMPRYPRLRVIIASATVDESLFAKYFGGASWVIEPGVAGTTVGKGVEGISPGSRTCALARSAGFTYPILQVWGDEVSAHLSRETFAECFGDPFRSPSGWQQLSDHLAGEYGPPPCLVLNVAKTDGLNPRYYPEFEQLVLNVKSNFTKVLNRSEKSAWKEIVRTLWQAAAKPRIVPLSMPGRPRDSDASAAILAEVMAEVALRDEQEAGARRARWVRWENGFSGGRRKPNEPAPRGNVLGFLPKKSEVTACAEMLKEKISILERNGELPPGKTVVLRAWGGETAEIEGEIEEATREPWPGDDRRRLIVATNVAETSLTLPNLAYVVDSGLVTTKQWNGRHEIEKFPTIAHSQSGLRQRVGRVGRKEPGVAFRLYTRAQHAQNHKNYSDPGILRERAEEIVLNAWSLGIDVTRPGVLLESPNDEEMGRALRRLQTFGALTDRTAGATGVSTQDVTRRGLELLTVQGDFHFRPLLMEADRYACLWEMVWFLALVKSNGQAVDSARRAALFSPAFSVDQSVVAGTCVTDQDEEETRAPNSPSVGGRRQVAWFEYPWSHVEGLAVHQAMRWDCCDDLELLLRVVQGWLFAPERSEWAREHYIREKVLTDAEATVQNLLIAFDDDAKGYQPRPFNFATLDKVRFLVASAFPERCYEWRDQRFVPKGTAVAEQEGGPRRLHPDSSRAGQEESAIPRGGQNRQATCILALNARGFGQPVREIVCLPNEFSTPDQLPSLTALTQTDVAIRFAEALTRLDDPTPPFALPRPLSGDSMKTRSSAPVPAWPFPRPTAGSYPTRNETGERQLPLVDSRQITRCVDGIAVKDAPESTQLVTESVTLIEDTHQFWPEIFVQVNPTCEASDPPAMLPARLLRPDNIQGGKHKESQRRYEIYSKSWKPSVKVVAVQDSNALVEVHRFLPGPLRVDDDVEWGQTARDLGGFVAYHRPQAAPPRPYEACWESTKSGWRLAVAPKPPVVAVEGERISDTAPVAQAARPPLKRVGEVVQAKVERVDRDSLHATVKDDGRQAEMLRWCASAHVTEWNWRCGQEFSALIVGVEGEKYWLSQIHTLRNLLTPGRRVPGAVIRATPALAVRIAALLTSEGVSIDYTFPPSYKHNFTVGKGIQCRIESWPDFPERLRIKPVFFRKGL